MTDRCIYHITTLIDWQNALTRGGYRIGSLESEGFIHASTYDQGLGTAQAHFAGQKGLVLLKINTEHLLPEVKYEPAQNGTLFPHIFGEINLEAVEQVTRFVADADGVFRTIGDEHA